MRAGAVARHSAAWAIICLTLGVALCACDSQSSTRVATPTYAPQKVMLLDTQHALHGQPAVLGSIPMGVFPREMTVNGSLALLTNFGSGSLSLIDMNKLPA